MQRLLDKANELKVAQGGIADLSIDSFADVVEALHLVQEEIGITGTTAKEAESTITGSIGMMKAAWSNLLVGVADSKQDITGLVDQFAYSVRKVGENVIPVVEQSIKGIGTLITQLLPPLLAAIPGMLHNILPDLLESTMSLLNAVFSALGQAIPALGEILTTDVLGMLTDIITQISENIAEQLPIVLENIMTWLLSFTESLRENARIFIEAGLNLFLQLVKGLMDALPMLIETVPTIVSNIAGIINDNAPKLLTTAAQLIWTLATGLLQAIPTLVANIPKIIKAIIDVFLAFNWLQLGKNLITKIKDGFIGENPYVINAAKKVKDSILDALKELPGKLWNLAKEAVGKIVSKLKDTSSISGAARGIKDSIVRILSELPSKMFTIGKDLLKGLWNGISNATGWVLDQIAGIGGSILKKIKKVFKINSPSKETESDGAFLMEGLGKGITGKLGSVLKTVNDMGGKVLGTARKALSGDIDTNIAVGYDVATKTKFASEMSTDGFSNVSATAAKETTEDKIDRLIILLDFYLAEILKKVGIDIQLDGETLIKWIDSQMAERKNLGLRGV